MLRHILFIALLGSQAVYANGFAIAVDEEETTTSAAKAVSAVRTSQESPVSLTVCGRGFDESSSKLIDVLRNNLKVTEAKSPLNILVRNNAQADTYQIFEARGKLIIKSSMGSAPVKACQDSKGNVQIHIDNAWTRNFYFAITPVAKNSAGRSRLRLNQIYTDGNAPVRLGIYEVQTAR